MKKIAIVGGNLLGCATTANLAIVDEVSSRDKLELTLFEKDDRLGGNSLKSVLVDEQEQLRVEVGTYRTLPLVPETHLTNLYEIANDQVNTFSLAGRRIRFPGFRGVRRGRNNAVSRKSMWDFGTYHRVVRSFGSWNWEKDAYDLYHGGWIVFDLLYRLLDNEIWRSVALWGLIASYRRLQATEEYWNRGMCLVQLVFMAILVLLSPKKVISVWQNQYSFWGTTIPLLVRYGITPAIARGSSVGFLKILLHMRMNFQSSMCPTIGTLITKCGLVNYLRGTGDDFTRTFKFNSMFVDQSLAPLIGMAQQGASMDEVSSLATHFALLDGDEINSDAVARIATLFPHNAALCAALIVAARATTPVDVQFNTKVDKIIFDPDKQKYELSLANGNMELFDGVVLCATPKSEADLKILSRQELTLHELLGYEKNRQVAEKFEEQEQRYREGNEVQECARTVDSEACSHFAVVMGRLKPSFFRYNYEKQVPDLLHVRFAPGLSRVERIRQPTKDKPGVYTVLCGSGFESDGLLGEMFEESAEVKYFQPMPGRAYVNTAFPEGMSIDDCCPRLILGPRFVYAAAFECLGKHPEIDAIAAINSASLFSEKIAWSMTTEDEAVQNEGEESEEGEESDNCDR